MKKIILFGIGNNGKDIMDAYGIYDRDFEVEAIADNHADLNEYAGVRVIPAAEIDDYEYDEIWIASIYHKEIKKQLIENLAVPSSKIRYIEYPLPFLEKVFYEKYSRELSGVYKCASNELQEVIDYVAGNGVRMYCYSFYDEYMNADTAIYFDEESGLYYGIYSNRRMYLSRKYDTLEKAKEYFQYVCMEQDKRSPHCYLTEHFYISEGDFGIDVGTAEGIFALQVVDIAAHIYLIEADPDWCEALRLTFRSDQDKVTIIQGYASDRDEHMVLSLDRILGNRKIDFIKMDIEGAELKALCGSEQLIRRCMPKLAVCTYHYAEEEKKIRTWLETIGGYTVRNSVGYVVCQGRWELENIRDADFRRALLWAERDVQ